MQYVVSMYVWLYACSVRNVPSNPNRSAFTSLLSIIIIFKTSLQVSSISPPKPSNLLALGCRTNPSPLLDPSALLSLFLSQPQPTSWQPSARKQTHTHTQTHTLVAAPTEKRNQNKPKKQSLLLSEESKLQREI
jgi:hypothetical protein